MPKRSLIHGHGINDADYKYRLTETINGKTNIIWQCPIHSTWKDLLRRCFSKKLKELRPYYKDVTVCDEWLRFSNFKSWIDTYDSYYDVDGNLLQLDKDLLIAGNKHYSPETCVFISRKVNNFLLDRHSKTRASSNVKGVSFCKKRGLYQVFCSDPLNRHSKFLGEFSCKEDAKACYDETKLSYLVDLMDNGYLDKDLFDKIVENFFSNIKEVS